MDKKELDVVRKTNDVKIVGTIKATKDLDPKMSKAGEEYVSGTVTVECMVDGVSNLFDIEVYQKRLTKDNKPSVLFDTYVGLASKIGQKYSISGSISENRFFDKKNSVMASAYKISGKWFNPAKITEADSAKFTFSGFINKPITQRTNKAGEIVCYDIELGQASYNDDKCSIYKFQVGKDDVAVINGCSTNYAIGSTVTIMGDLSCVVETKTVEEKSAFGQPTYKVYTNTTKRFWIRSGNLPVMDGSQYSLLDVQTLKEAYAKKDLELSSAAQATASAGMNTMGAQANSISSRQSSLI